MYHSHLIYRKIITIRLNVILAKVHLHYMFRGLYYSLYVQLCSKILVSYGSSSNAVHLPYLEIPYSFCWRRIQQSTRIKHTFNTNLCELYNYFKFSERKHNIVGSSFEIEIEIKKGTFLIKKYYKNHMCFLKR